MITCIKNVIWLWKNSSQIFQKLITQREDINSNTTDCAKMLYRLEEAELQAKILKTRVDYLETPIKGSCT